MPICYEVLIGSDGSEYCSDKISHTYRNYYGPNKPYTEYERFSMNIDKHDLELFKKITKCSISKESIDLNNYNDAITLNYNRTKNEVTLSGPGEFFSTELCFQEDFRKYLN